VKDEDQDAGKGKDTVSKHFCSPQELLI